MNNMFPKYIIEAFIEDNVSKSDFEDNDISNIDDISEDDILYAKNSQLAAGAALNEFNFYIEINVHGMPESGIVHLQEIHRGLFDVLYSIRRIFIDNFFILYYPGMEDRNDNLNKFYFTHVPESFKSIPKDTLYFKVLLKGFKYVPFDKFEMLIRKIRQISTYLEEYFHHKVNMAIHNAAALKWDVIYNTGRLDANSVIKLYKVLFSEDISDKKSEITNATVEFINRNAPYFANKIISRGTILAKDKYNLNLTVVNHFMPPSFENYAGRQNMVMCIRLNSDNTESEYSYKKFLNCLYFCVYKQIDPKLLKYGANIVYVTTNVNLVYDIDGIRYTVGDLCANSKDNRNKFGTSSGSSFYFYIFDENYKMLFSDETNSMLAVKEVFDKPQEECDKEFQKQLKFNKENPVQ